jgi:hypothetical protein
MMPRRNSVPLCRTLAFLALLPVVAVAGQTESARARVERWGMLELTLKGPDAGNPFLDVTLSAQFKQEDRVFEAEGFYDGSGVYRIRFMPVTVGQWTYATKSNCQDLDGKTGSLTCVEPSPDNHGPVRVHNTYHFAYADGTPYFPIGTTCYAWAHQGDVLEEQTLATLKTSPFNKMRMCVFPKNYLYNKNEPQHYPFEGTPLTNWDYTRFNPKFFQHVEKRVADLLQLGIEADIILFHPYDRWGFATMPAETNDRYLRYVIARLAAYRNVWWSLANEYDFMKSKKASDWDHFFQIVRKYDPFGHLRSIHNGSLLYNHTQPWVTHASIQNGSLVADFGRAGNLRDVYRKPIVYDEVCYEGNLERRWGNLSAEEMVHRFWQGSIAGTYVGHGETYIHPQDILWWSKGGVLRGQSPSRIAFLRTILENGPAEGLEPIDKWQNPYVAGKKGEYYLIYFGKQRPTEWRFELPGSGLSKGIRFRVEMIDTWNMAITPVEQTYTIKPQGNYVFVSEENAKISLPGRPYMALRITRADQPVYLFASFRNNGEDGLHLAYSHDTYHWTDLGKSFLAPKVGVSKLMRDPFILLGPDGTFHMVWTAGWGEKGIGYARSKDLLHWSEQQYLEVMAHEPTTLNAWAPEIAYDEENKQFLIFWASTIPGRYPGDDEHSSKLNHRMYCVTTPDFEVFSKTKLLFDPGYSVIDATIIPRSGGYAMIFKDERRPMRRLRVAFSEHIGGPYKDISEPLTEMYTEGPTALKTGDEWLVYYDRYRAKDYGAIKTKDLKTWTDVTADVSCPHGQRHGAVLKISREILSGLMK